MASCDIVAEIAKTIGARRRLYDGSYTGDLDRLRAVHGPGAVLEALQTLERRSGVTWDASGHRAAVQDAVGRLLQRRQQHPDRFDDATKI